MKKLKELVLVMRAVVLAAIVGGLLYRWVHKWELSKWRNQPKTITTSIGGQIISSRVTTNPYSAEYVVENVWTPTGQVKVATWRTNKLW